MTEADIHARFVRYYETVAELHRMGYELFRVCPYISPNGMRHLQDRALLSKLKQRTIVLHYGYRVLRYLWVR